MKRIFYFSLFISLIFFSCKENDNDTWPEADKAYYENVISLQEMAFQDFESALQTMDSAEAIGQLRAFFLADPSVVTAETGSQGIAVQYSNGMRGGIFLNTEDEFETDSTQTDLRQSTSYGELPQKALVNKKKAVFLNPSYWERSGISNGVIASYNQNLPKAGFVLQNIYKSMDASVDRFTQLSDYGLIHIYSHGWAWPDKNNIQEVYVLTGEKVNEGTSWKYWDEILKGNIILAEAKVAENTRDNVYLLREQFIADHNDFSQDTVLFYGGFCFSHLGSWPEIEQTFGNGAYFGFNWRVETNWNGKIAKSLIESLTDTLVTPAATSEKWWSNPVPAKKLWDNGDGKFCNILYTGDAGLKLVKDPELYYGKKYGGGIIFFIDEQKKHGLIMAETDQSTGAPFGCFETLIGGTSGELGTGQANTTALINGCGESGTAARICNDLVLNGYSDWYLPSTYELRYMYYASDDFGNFSNGAYYSSTENGASFGVACSFPDGQEYNEFKNVPLRVRAIRTF